MNAPVLTGMFAAWTAAQLALGAFFMMAFVARRSDREYLLFGLLCLALAGIDAGLTLTYAAKTIDEWREASRLLNGMAALAAALNTHFVLSYTGRLARRTVALIYGAGALLLIPALTDLLYARETLRVERVSHMGTMVDQVLVEPTGVGFVFDAALVLIPVSLTWPLARAVINGKREALSTLVAALLMTVFVCHDVLVVVGAVRTTYLSPYGFLTYGFGVANTLLMRYRRAAAELEDMADELRHATDELTSSYLELSDVQEELFRRRQLASVGELAASIAHEVRNPLAIIQNAGANLKRASLGQGDRETLFEIIEEEVKRLNGLVTELLRFARPVNVQRSDVALAELFRNVSAAMKGPCALVTRIPEDPELHTVWADPALLRLAIDNLIENSCQAMPDGGTVHVRVSKGDIGSYASVRLEITDEGAGMSENTLQRATDPFFTTRPKGTGLGLPIAQRILEAHDGRLELMSEMGRGTTAIIELPIRRRESMSHVDQRKSDAGTPVTG